MDKGAGVPLEAADIRRYLTRRDVCIETHEVLDSTNTRARTLALTGAPEPTLVTAEMQTAGRGRQGRKFFSPAGSGIYMSLLLRPESLERPERFTAAAAVAAAETIERLSGRKTQIKWVNDVYMDGRKVVGILTEAGPMPGGGFWVSVGIGVNLLPPGGGFPEELAETAGAALPSGGRDLRAAAAAGITDRLLSLYDREHMDLLLAAYRSRDFLLGKEVYIIQNDKGEKVLAAGIDDAFCLRVKKEDGTVEHLRSGEVHIGPVPG